MTEKERVLKQIELYKAVFSKSMWDAFLIAYAQADKAEFIEASSLVDSFPWYQDKEGLEWKAVNNLLYLFNPKLFGDITFSNTVLSKIVAPEIEILKKQYPEKFL